MGRKNVRGARRCPIAGQKGGWTGLSALLPVSRCYRFHAGQQSRRPAFGRHVPSSARDDRGCDPGDRSKYGCDPAHEPSDGSARRPRRPKDNIFALLILCGRLPAQANLGCLSPWLRFGSVSEVTPRVARGSMRRPSVLGPVFLSLWPDGNRPAELKSPSQCWLDPVGRLALERGNKVRLPRSIQIIRQFNWWVRSRRHNATSSR